MINTPMVETYVEVAIVYNKSLTVIKHTNIDEGSTPKWNEVLQFDLRPTDGKAFTKEELTSSETRIVITLFDKRRDWMI